MLLAHANSGFYQPPLQNQILLVTDRNRSSPSHHLLRTMNTPSATPVWIITGPSMGLERPLTGKALTITTNGTAEGVL